jgi:hypothetical protein
VRLRFLPLLACGLAACGGTDNGPLAQCEQQAMQDPAVQEIYTRTNGYYTFPWVQRDDLLAAKKQATVRCMRAKGLAPPGGVQPVAPR